MKQQVIFGGSFNPFHNGHFALVQAVLHEFPQCELRIIPTGNPPHKRAQYVADRYRTVIIHKALEGLTNWVLDPCEMERQGRSYTVETLDFLAQKGLLQKKPFLMIGDDWVDSFYQWKNADQVARRVELLVFHRKSPEKLPFDFPHRYLNNSIVNVSSSEIREKLKKKESIKGMVPVSVEAYIKQHELYNT